MSNPSEVGLVFNLTGGGSGGSVRLQSLAVVNPPEKTIYKSGESFDPTGMVVEAGYSFGLTSEVTGYTVTPAVLTDGVTEVIITYTEGRVIETTSTPVTVEKVLTSIEVTTPPTKTLYDYLESFDPTGMVVTATFSDSSSESVTGYSYTNAAFSTLGDQVVNLDYTYEGVTKSTHISVVVNAIEMAIPVQKDILTYDGTSKSPAWDGYDSIKMALTGDVNGVNARTYTVKFTLSYGYLFSNGASEVTVDWVISRAVIASLPVQSNNLVADGTSKSPIWEGYEAGQLTIGGDTSATEPGDYTATFTPTANYQWWDGTTETKSVTWTIISIIVPIPTQKDSLIYTGAVQTPEWDNFDAENCSVQVTPATDAGEYTATFSLLRGMWSDGTMDGKTVKWTIERATIAKVPAQINGPKYDGNPKTPTWDANYDPTKMTLSVEAKINAGTYTATFTPTANYKWSDGSFDAKVVSWIIEKGDNDITVSSTSLVLNASTKSTKFTVTRKGSGTISVTSSDTKVATIGSINQITGEVVVNSVKDTTGSSFVTVKVAKDGNYLTPANKTISVTAQFTNIYGVEWDWTNGKFSKGVRTDAAAGFKDPSPAVNNGSGSSPFDNLMPWSGMVKETRAGGVEVKEPKYWFKWTKTGKKLKLQIAAKPVQGFYVDPVNMNRGDGLGELDFSYIGRYHCARDTYKSETNKPQKKSITLDDARFQIHKLGDNFWQIDFAQMWYVGMLYLVEFADWDGQATIGYGCTAIDASSENNGKTDAMKYHTGTTAVNRTTYGYTQYRNIEGWWDNVYDWMDGCYYTDYGLYIIKNPAKFVDDSDRIFVGKPVNGCPLDFAIPTKSGLEWALYPCDSIRNDVCCVPDGWQFSPYFSGKQHLYHGGGQYQTQSDGPFSVGHCSTDAGPGDVGCRLQERPPRAA